MALRSIFTLATRDTILTARPLIDGRSTVHDGKDGKNLIAS